MICLQFSSRVDLFSVSVTELISPIFSVIFVILPVVDLLSKDLFLLLFLHSERTGMSPSSSERLQRIDAMSHATTGNFHPKVSSQAFVSESFTLSNECE